MKKTIEERKEYAKVIAQAWADEEFKKRLLVEPEAVLKENSIEIPDGMTVKIVERKENEILLPLPSRPRDITSAVKTLEERIQAYTVPFMTT